MRLRQPGESTRLPAACAVDHANTVAHSKFFVQLLCPEIRLRNLSHKRDRTRIDKSQVMRKVADAQHTQEFGGLRIFVAVWRIDQEDFADLGIENRRVNRQ